MRLYSPCMHERNKWFTEESPHFLHASTEGLGMRLAKFCLLQSVSHSRCSASKPCSPGAVTSPSPTTTGILQPGWLRYTGTWIARSLSLSTLRRKVRVERTVNGQQMGSIQLELYVLMLALKTDVSPNAKLSTKVRVLPQPIYLRFCYVLVSTGVLLQCITLCNFDFSCLPLTTSIFTCTRGLTTVELLKALELLMCCCGQT